MQSFYRFTEAFDTINHEILLEKLNCCGIRSKEDDWFHSFLTNKKQHVSIEKFFSQTKIVKCGFGTCASNLHKRP